MISAHLCWRAAALFVLAFGIAAPAAAQERREPNLLDKLFGNSERMGGGENQPSAVPGGAGSQADLVVRIERLEAQVRQLTGENEQLQYRNRQLEAQIQRMGGVPVTAGPAPVPRGPMAAAALPPPVPASPPPVVPASPPPPALGTSPSSLIPPATIPAGRRSDAFDPTLHPDAPGAPVDAGDGHRAQSRAARTGGRIGRLASKRSTAAAAGAQSQCDRRRCFGGAAIGFAPRLL